MADQNLGDQLRARSASCPDASPPAAFGDPLTEIVLNEVAAQLPADVRNRLLNATAANVSGWLAAGALYCYITNDHQRRRFLQVLGAAPADPGQAAAAFGRSYADQVEPPIRSERWCSLDFHGLVMAVAVCAGALGVRTALLWTAAWLALPVAARWDNYVSLNGWPLLTTSLRPSWLTAALLLALAGWFALETVWLPRLAEYLRRLPIRRAGLPVPTSWRLDTFSVCWCTYACFLMFAFLVRLGFYAYECRMHAGTAYWTAVIGGGWMSLFLVACVMEAFHATVDGACERAENG